MAKKILVAYFSCTGTTGRVAKELAAAAGADIYEIRPARPYTRADLDWTNRLSRSTVECKDKTARPELADREAHVEDYDVVFVGFPVWWYTAPNIIWTFLESYDFSGKTVIPFGTSGGSGLGNTEKTMKELCPSADVRQGRVLNGRQTPERLAEWVGGLKLD